MTLRGIGSLFSLGHAGSSMGFSTGLSAHGEKKVVDIVSGRSRYTHVWNLLWSAFTILYHVWIPHLFLYALKLVSLFWSIFFVIEFKKPQNSLS